MEEEVLQVASKVDNMEGWLWRRRRGREKRTEGREGGMGPREEGRGANKGGREAKEEGRETVERNLHWQGEREGKTQAGKDSF